MRKHNAAFGKALRTLRLSSRKTQEALALDSGLDRTYISLLELGSRSPTLDTIYTLARALQVPVLSMFAMIEQILEDEDE